MNLKREERWARDKEEEKWEGEIFLLLLLSGENVVEEERAREALEIEAAEKAIWFGFNPSKNG